MQTSFFIFRLPENTFIIQSIIMKKIITYPLLLLTFSTLLAACASNNASQGCTSAPAGQYCIQKGDTLTRIGQRFRVSVAELKRWNNLPNDNIHAGSLLIIKAPTGTSSKTITTGNFNLQWPVKGNVISNYSSTNRGIDIAAERGTLVHAAADGTVIYADNNIRNYGNLILIRHNSTTITAYANNQTILIPLNAKVKAGQIIAEVGDTGRTDGRSALHFELRVNGKHVNPMSYLK